MQILLKLNDKFRNFFQALKYMLNQKSNYYSNLKLRIFPKHELNMIVSGQQKGS